MEALIDGLMIAPPYICLALAYGLVYGMLGVMDLTITTRFTAAAYGGWCGSKILGMYPAYDPAALCGGILVAAVLSTACWWLLTPLIRQNSLSTLVGSMGLHYFIQAMLQFIFGATPRVYESYPVEGGLTLGPAVATKLQWIGMIYAMGALLVMALLLRSRGWGRRLSAVAADADFAESVLAVSQGRITWSASVVGSLVTAPAAVIYAASHGVTPSTGAEMGLLAFVATIVAGRGHPLGAVGVVILLVIIRSVAIRWTVLELTCVTSCAAGLYLLFFDRRIANVRTSLAGVIGVVGGLWLAGVLQPRVSSRMSVVVPASFQDVVPFGFVIVGLLLKPRGWFASNATRVI